MWYFLARISDLQLLRRKYENVETFLEAPRFACRKTDETITKYTLAQIAEMQLRSLGSRFLGSRSEIIRIVLRFLSSLKNSARHELTRRAKTLLSTSLSSVQKDMTNIL